MTAELALVLAAVVGLVALSIFDRVTIRALAGQVLDSQLEMEREHRAERERLMRVLIAKNTGELANLERIENAARKVEAQAARPGFGSEAEYQAWLAADLEKMVGPGAAERVFDGVPLVPEGMG